MTTPPPLYDNDSLWDVFSTNHHVWGDVRRLKPFLWMMIGLIMEGSVQMPDWAPTWSVAPKRRPARCFQGEHIDVARIWRPYVRSVLDEWEGRLVVIVDTTTLWGQFCWVRVSIPYRGRALPIAWSILAHRRTRVRFAVYRQMLEQAATMLPPLWRCSCWPTGALPTTPLSAGCRPRTGIGACASSVLITSTALAMTGAPSKR